MKKIIVIAILMISILITPVRCAKASTNFDENELCLDDSEIKIVSMFRNKPLLVTAYDYGYAMISGHTMEVFAPMYMIIDTYEITFNYNDIENSENDYYISLHYIFDHMINNENVEQETLSDVINISDITEAQYGRDNIFEQWKWKVEKIENGQMKVSIRLSTLHDRLDNKNNTVLKHIGIRLLNVQTLKYGNTIEYDFEYAKDSLVSIKTFTFWQYPACVRIDARIINSDTDEILWNDYVASSFGVRNMHGLSRVLTEVVTPSENIIESILYTLPEMLYKVFNGLLIILTYLPELIMKMLPIIPNEIAYCITAIIYFVIIYRVFKVIRG